MKTRFLALATAAIFLISSVFPIVAGLIRHPEAFPKWWGSIDVGFAFVLGIFVIALVGLTQSKVDQTTIATSYRIYRNLNHAIVVLIVIFFLAGDHVTWTNCLTGFAWRAWLLVYALPSWIMALKPVELQVQ